MGSGGMGTSVTLVAGWVRVGFLVPPARVYLSPVAGTDRTCYSSFPWKEIIL